MKKYTYKFNKDFFSDGGALTLPQSSVTRNEGLMTGVHTRTHKDGWKITGEIHEDYFVWVNEFEAVHPRFGRVWGDFEKEVFADKVSGFKNFYNNHPPDDWDYGDI